MLDNTINYTEGVYTITIETEDNKEKYTYESVRLGKDTVKIMHETMIFLGHKVLEFNHEDM